MNKFILLTFVLFATAGTARADKSAGTPDDWAPPIPKPGPFSKVLGDRLELGTAEGEESYAWDVQGWYGYDWNRLRWKTEGEGEVGSSPESGGRAQPFCSRCTGPCAVQV